MHKIKFRGKDADGMIHYGGYCEDVSGISTIIDEYGDDFKVFADSVAQLVGYDDDGNEVYDDDCLVRDNGAEAGMTFFIETEDEDGDHDIFNIGEKLYGYKLKES